MERQLAEEKVFKDPVHKSVYVQDQLIWNLINTKEFQRLRRIRQLGTSYLTFHGAEHSRFSHSLGVYEITRRIISQFERNEYSDWPRQERLPALCAALLHDLGHGPFSHSIEDVFDTDHEDWTCRIIMGDTEVNQVLREIDDRFPERVAAIIKKKYDKPIVVNLVSSQMDADRMDYLLRDAYFTGVHYGTFDLERILRVLRPYQGRIVVKESGMHAVEDYLMSRYQMYWQVYFHPVTRSSEIILKQILRRAKELYLDGYRFEWLPRPLLRLFQNELTTDDYFLLDEALAQTVFMAWADERDEWLSDLSRRFLHRRLYKDVVVNNHSEELFDEAKLQLKRAGLQPDYHLEVDFPFDLPYDVYQPDAGTNKKGNEKPPILLLDAKGDIAEISARSDIIRSLSGLHQGKHRWYYPDDLLRPVAHRLDERIRKIFGY
ncbi:HD domain-containing protein [Paenibacillus sp. MMS18-CY102]|uniref:HD domain-containing protein n=1 Tax=Paenibacillus sp. MMS18-CY102 TaxID=2682849 RepID=UPI001365C68A|nr:HD domain-containing protein [Paenibacillus sp. MMS18-CY102]